MQPINNDATLPDDFLEVLDDADDEEQDQLSELWERLEILREELRAQEKNLSVVEYNKKRAIFEYFNHLDSNGKGKIKASETALQLVYIDVSPYLVQFVIGQLIGLNIIVCLSAIKENTKNYSFS